MKINIVNDKDEIIETKERGILDNDKDIYRVSSLWITNSEGKILLAQRSFNKKHHPGKGGPAVAGTNDAGETYESNILKEAEEELGLKDIKPKKEFKIFVDRKYKHFTQWFSLKLDKDLSDFRILKSEVAEIKWVTEDELLNMGPELLDGMKELSKKFQ